MDASIVVAIVGSCEESVGEVQCRNALQMLKNTQFPSNLSKNILEEKFTSNYHVSNLCHENDSKSKSDDWKLQTWQRSLWNPLEPHRCVSSCPYSKHVQKSRNVYTKWLQGAKFEIQKDFSYKILPIGSGEPIGSMGWAPQVPIESTGGSYHRPLLDISTAT